MGKGMLGLGITLGVIGGIMMIIGTAGYMANVIYDETCGSTDRFGASRPCGQPSTVPYWMGLGVAGGGILIAGIILIAKASNKRTEPVRSL